ncbi:MAG TPA: hypothetical protein VE467_15640 [Chryseolinea sp.]|jgi:hypothetical protein|nr:hypothetical protein [Chryseolinea sp.]
MKDQLDNFIRKNREGFDDKEPSEKVWHNIESSMKFSTPTSRGNGLVWWRAAAIFFMALSAYLLVPKQVIKSQTSELVASEFSDVEEFYVKQISEKVELIDGFQKNEGLNGFTQDFKQLEAMYMILKEEMKSSPSEKVKDALVLNLLVRINLLNQQLYKLDQEYGKTEKKDEEV